MRKLISEFLAEDSRVEVIGTARNGRDAINIKTRCRNFGCGNADYGRIGSIKPDNECPTAVVMLSSATKKGTENTFVAMNSGAFDFVAKPSGAVSLIYIKSNQERTP
ncbi:response regulator [Peribacillus sp. S4]|uniref:response regulator n=1 Tax=Peribacillus sp. S4 TaxID=3384451 RepID=UPI003989AF2F